MRQAVGRRVRVRLAAPQPRGCSPKLRAFWPGTQGCVWAEWEGLGLRGAAACSGCGPCGPEARALPAQHRGAPCGHRAYARPGLCSPQASTGAGPSARSRRGPEGRAGPAVPCSTPLRLRAPATLSTAARGRCTEPLRAQRRCKVGHSSSSTRGAGDGRVPSAGGSASPSHALHPSFPSLPPRTRFLGVPSAQPRQQSPWLWAGARRRASGWC